MGGPGGVRGDTAQYSDSANAQTVHPQLTNNVSELIVQISTAPVVGLQALDGSCGAPFSWLVVRLPAAELCVHVCTGGSQSAKPVVWLPAADSDRLIATGPGRIVDIRTASHHASTPQENKEIRPQGDNPFDSGPRPSLLAEPSATNLRAVSTEAEEKRQHTAPVLSLASGIHTVSRYGRGLPQPSFFYGEYWTESFALSISVPAIGSRVRRGRAWGPCGTDTVAVSTDSKAGFDFGRCPSRGAHPQFASC
jgi:hypothetical protein